MNYNQEENENQDFENRSPRNEEEEDKKDQEEENAQNIPNQKKKKKTQQFRLKPEQITDPKKGVVYLYNLCKDYRFGNDELDELNKYMHVIEEWHYQIMPKYDFDYFTNRLQKFGGNNSVQTHLQFLRKAHKGLIPWHFVLNPLGEQPINDQTLNQTFNETITNNYEIQEEHQQQNLIQNDQNLSQPEPQQNIATSVSQKKPLKLSLKKQNIQSQVQSVKKELTVRFNDEVQYEPSPKPIQVDENFDDIFEQLEAAYKIKEEKKLIN